MHIPIINADGGRNGLRWRSIGLKKAMTLLLGAMTASVQAAEWRVNPGIDFASTYEDNVELSTDGDSAESTSAYIVAPRVSIVRTTETSKVDINGYVAFTDYQSGEIEDKSESAVVLTSHNQTSERATVGLNGELRRDTLFERFRQGAGVGDLRDTDIGSSTSTEVRRNYRAFQPYFNWLLSERDAVRFDYRLTDVNFSNSGGTGLVNYRENFIGGTYSRALSERDSATLTVNSFRYRPDDNDAEADTLQLLVGLARKFGESSRGNFAVGASNTRQTENGEDDRTSGVVLRAGIEQRSEISQLDAVISRDVTPSGLGRALLSDQYRIRWLRKTSPRVDFVLEGQYLRSRLLEGNDPNVDRRYIEIEPHLRWHWLEDWVVSGSYRYRYQKFDAASDSADSNAVFVGVNYTF